MNKDKKIAKLENIVKNNNIIINLQEELIKEKNEIIKLLKRQDKEKAELFETRNIKTTDLLKEQVKKIVNSLKIQNGKTK